MASGTSFDLKHTIVNSVSDDETTHLLTSHERKYLKESFFDELFEKYCHVSIEKTEISFVQKNVECFVEKVIEKVLGSEQYQKFVEEVDRERLIRFKYECNNDNILKVGSFYEGTKNNYPDEFDFIFILGECDYKDVKRIKILTSKLSDIFHEQVKDLLKTPTTELENTFEVCQYKGLHGPASKIKLVFNETANIRNRTIYVDISVASRVRIDASLPKELKVSYDEWQQMLLETGSILVIKVYKNDHPKHETGVKFTITETEQDFVRHNMSEKQRKIYRLLKYIFNGNDANEIIRNLVRRPDNKLTKLVKYYWGTKVFGPRIIYDIPSYTIKTFMFHHVHKCTKAECSVSECLLAVLGHFLAVFNVKIDKYTTVFQDRLGMKGFSVAIDTVLGQPLEIADDYVSAAVIAKNISEMIKSVQYIDQRLEIRPDIKKHIPFTERNANIVKSVLDERGKRKVCSPRRLIFVVVTTVVVLAGFISAFAIVDHLADKACAADHETPTNNSSYTQYCCDGRKDSTECWLNVTCSENNTIVANNTQTITALANKMQTTTSLAGNTKTITDLTSMTQTVIENTLTELKWTFASMALKLVNTCDNSSTSEADDRRVLDFIWNRVKLKKEISDNKFEKEFYLHCNAKGSKARVGVDIHAQLKEHLENTCLTLTASCYSPQHPPFLKITTTNKSVGIDVVLEHYFCDTGDICTADSLSSNQLQRCFENKIGEGGWTEICCSNDDSGLKDQSDECNYYTDMRSMINSIRSIAQFFFVSLPAFIIFIRGKRAAIRFVKRIRRSM